MSAHDQLVEMMENYIAENKKFSEKKVKAAATRARAALQEIGIESVWVSYKLPLLVFLFPAIIPLVLIGDPMSFLLPMLGL